MNHTEPDNVTDNVGSTFKLTVQHTWGEMRNKYNTLVEKIQEEIGHFRGLCIDDSMY
jgi:hypothetical protein